jgi:hypothetical protein
MLRLIQPKQHEMNLRKRRLERYSEDVTLVPVEG